MSKAAIDCHIFPNGELRLIPPDVLRKAKKANGKKLLSHRRTRGSRIIESWAKNIISQGL